MPGARLDNIAQKSGKKIFFFRFTAFTGGPDCFVFLVFRSRSHPFCFNNLFPLFLSSGSMKLTLWNQILAFLTPVVAQYGKCAICYVLEIGFPNWLLIWHQLHHKLAESSACLSSNKYIMKKLKWKERETKQQKN